MASSLIEHKRINTTLAKAKELRKFVEPLITKSKTDSTHSRRIVYSYLGDKHAVTELFREIAPKVGERPGGYTRILKTGNRLGDNAEMCFIELVDYNETYVKSDKKKGKARRSRSGGKDKTATAEKQAIADVSEEVAEDAIEVAEKTTNAPEAEVIEAKAEETAPDEAPEATEPAAKKTEKKDKDSEKKD